MNLLLEKRYINKILANKKLLISELIDEFGSQYEDLLNERFDRVKFIFFVSLTNMEKYLRNKYSCLAANKIVEFIKENGLLNDVYINDRFKDICGYTIDSFNEKDLFDNIFDTPFLNFNFKEEHKGVFGIYSFDTSKEYNLLSLYAKKRNITTKEFIENNRCRFLKSIGKYPTHYSNEMISNDLNYPSLCHYYEELMKKYNRILNEVKEKFKNDIDIFNELQNIRIKIFIDNYKKMLEELIIYLSETDKEKVASGQYTLEEIDFLNVFFSDIESLNNESRVETLPKEERQMLFSLYYGENNEKRYDDIVESINKVRKKAAKRYNKQILETFTIEANCDISNINIDNDVSLSNSQLFTLFEQDDGLEKDRILFFDPYACDEECLDIHLRHELRHSLTSSVRRENDLVIVKVGNAEYIYSGEELISTNNAFYNELLTQKSAIENTKRTFEKGIYILSPNGASFPKVATSIYDEYLPEFNKIYSAIPLESIISQIEFNNENLYSFISLEQIKQLEDSLYSYNNIPKDILDTISSRNKGTRQNH